MWSLQGLKKQTSPPTYLHSPSALLQQSGARFRGFAFAHQGTSEWTWQSMTTPARSRITATQRHTAGLTRRSQGVPSLGQRTTETGKTRTRKMQQRLRPRNSGALVLRFQHDPVATQRKSSHQTVSAMTRRKDIIKGIRGEGKTLEYSRHFLSDFCSSGIGIETFGRVSSLACWGKAVSVGTSCFFSLSSSCTNRGRSCVCFRGRRSRKTERDEQKWQMESAQNDNLEVCKALGQPSSQRKNKLPWRAEPLVAWVTPALELQNPVLSAELTNIWIRITHVLSQTSGSWPRVFCACPPRKAYAQNLLKCFGIGMVEKKSLRH